MSMTGCQEGMAMGDAEKTPLAKAEDMVTKLYEFRDLYYDKFGLDRARLKNEDVKSRMSETVEALDVLQGQISNKAIFHMLKGKALNVLPAYDGKAQEALSKAVKLDPKLVEAWNNLGECYWKCEDIVAAKNCFTGALNYSKNKVSLRNLSMVLRQLSGSPTERAKLIEESVEKAKEAVQLDIKDGSSWVILGNAHLSMFFAGGQHPKSLKQALSAYAQAEKDPISRNNPDLHYNRSVMYKYQEEYQLALEGFARAGALDPSWPEPGNMVKQVLAYLQQVSDLISTKGKMKAKRLQSLCQSISESDLGPYGGGSYTSPKGKTIKLTKVLFSSLQPELNAEKVVVGKVVCTVASEDVVPFTFCMADEAEMCLYVSVYNMIPGFGVKIGDSVAIPEPFLQVVSVHHKDKGFHFHGIRVDSPVVLVINGLKQGLDKQAPMVLAVSAVSD
ncbi:tetratricopeptide repeat protein 5-like [Liolophura sinensis]|uniref:tetratricopeptide repeat protein 5-like n=1 Tax=Liolophura sinensis TaxID=3198878 RepID=UPI003158CE4D